MKTVSQREELFSRSWRTALGRGQDGSHPGKRPGQLPQGKPSHPMAQAPPQGLHPVRMNHPPRVRLGRESLEPWTLPAARQLCLGTGAHCQRRSGSGEAQAWPLRFTWHDRDPLGVPAGDSGPGQDPGWTRGAAGSEGRVPVPGLSFPLCRLSMARAEGSLGSPGTRGSGGRGGLDRCWRAGPHGPADSVSPAGGRATRASWPCTASRPSAAGTGRPSAPQPAPTSSTPAPRSPAPAC